MLMMKSGLGALAGLMKYVECWRLPDALGRWRGVYSRFRIQASIWIAGLGVKNPRLVPHNLANVAGDSISV